MKKTLIQSLSIIGICALSYLNFSSLAAIAAEASSSNPISAKKTVASSAIENELKPDPAQTTEEQVQDHKLVIYQLMPRLFGNTRTRNKTDGSLDENGVGKFNDISHKALTEIKKLGASHVWYTGVLAHATMSDYAQFGLAMDDPDIVKGRAGSPYAIRDYYDLDPDLAQNVAKRMQEFDQLVQRTHQHGLKVLIDFIPNHVARSYHSKQKPAGVIDFGAKDNTSLKFSPANDFYYLPGQRFTVPKALTEVNTDAVIEPLNAVLESRKPFVHPLQDGKFAEFPAKATGNNIFSAQPALSDWWETIKLNYGVDLNADASISVAAETVASGIGADKQNHFDPVPPVWLKMRDILHYWASKNVDGFRCDVAEIVPVQFWSWVIPQIKKDFPEIVFIAESYDARAYQQYLTQGHFDYLYDKVGLYDSLKSLVRNQPDADVASLGKVWREQSRGFSSKMLRFMENHDEERIASKQFAENPHFAKPAMVLAATMGSGPVLIYNGQEVGEAGAGIEGFSGDDGRTTIFDYWGMPEHQKWMNHGAFDGALLSTDARNLRSFYSRLLNLSRQSTAIRKGQFYELPQAAGFSKRQYAYLRYTDQQLILVVANFEREQILQTNIALPEFIVQKFKLKNASGALKIRDLLSADRLQHKGGNVVKLNAGKLSVSVAASDALVLELSVQP